MMKYQINSLVEMKKPHACGTNLWKVTRVGVDIKIRCIKCKKKVFFTSYFIFLFVNFNSYCCKWNINFI